MTIEQAIIHAEEVADRCAVTDGNRKCEDEHRQLAEWLKDLKELREKMRWIPVKWHDITDEERRENNYPKDWAAYIDSEMPCDGERVLITTKGGFVEMDECYSDDGMTFGLDSGYDWIDDVVAWMPLPEPYKEGT